MSGVAGLARRVRIPLALICSHALGFFVLLCLFLNGGSDNIRRVIAVAISKFSVLVSIQFVLYAVEGRGDKLFFWAVAFQPCRSWHVLLIADLYLECPQPFWKL